MPIAPVRFVPTIHSHGCLVGIEAEFFVRLGVPGVHLHQLVTVRVGCDVSANLLYLPILQYGMFPTLMSQYFAKESFLIRGLQVTTTAT
jgi:hypothetical protein